MYLWIFIVGILFSFYNSWGIGANDCANSFATSVGAKVLNLRQAVLIAAIFEFSGAVFMGSHVTDTVRKKIVNQSLFEDEPGALMYGMLCANLSAAIWLTVATYFKYPVSTTHSIIGSIIGFSLAYAGADAVKWEMVGFIVLSWVLSPLLAGIFSSVFFFLINRFIFNSSRPFENTMKLFPGLTFFTFFINVLFIIYKGSPQLELDELPLWVALLSSILIGIFTAVMAQFLYLPYVKKKILKNEAERNNTNDKENDKENVIDIDDESDNSDNINKRTDSYKVAIDNTTDESNTDDNCNNSNEEYNKNEVRFDESLSIEENIKKGKEFVTYLEGKKLDDEIEVLHQNAHIIEPKSDELCSWLQIITACFSSFAHGSNDVANSVAPLATIYYIYKYNEVTKKADVPIWILVLGGVGIVFGLATWGYKIINRMGREITKISASRGFIIELAAALTVIIASRAEMPVSTTHCQVGSVVGCGLVAGRKNIQWKLIKGILFSWLITLPFAGLLSAGLFSYGYYSP
jgi:sodium-dependent phosphate transporter